MVHVTTRRIREDDSYPVTIGIDLGQRRDHSAFAIARIMEGDNHDIHLIERVPLGTSFPDVADRAVQLRESVLAKTGQKPCIMVDATGYGLPVVEMFKERGLHVTPVEIIGGSTLSAKRNGTLCVGKSYLVSRLQALFAEKRIHFSVESLMLEAMVDELTSFELRRTEAANLSFGAFKTGKHDDLVIAVGLAVLRRRKPGGGHRTVQYG